jgi:hypothetical protein
MIPDFRNMTKAELLAEAARRLRTFDLENPNFYRKRTVKSAVRNQRTRPRTQWRMIIRMSDLRSGK